jgi:cytochrome c-type biogenesis protein CcmH
MRRLIFAVLMMLAAGPAFAVQPDEKLADPALEARARVLSAELRCMVCQNQSIDDSDAQLAKDLRLLVRERLVAGDSNDEVLDFLVARYGEFVLLKPRLNGETLVLWLAAPGLVLIGGIAAWLAWRRRSRTGEAALGAKLDADEEAALQSMLGSGTSKAKR